MTSRVLPAILAALLCSTIFASQPGQPLDCSDWVLLDSRLSCAEQADASQCGGFCRVLNSLSVDNDGNLLQLYVIPKQDFQGNNANCGGQPLWRLELRQLKGPLASVLGYLEERCVTSTPFLIDHFSVFTGVIDEALSLFEPSTGNLLLGMGSSCADENTGLCSYSPTGPRLLAIAGFLGNTPCSDADSDSWANCATSVLRHRSCMRQSGMIRMQIRSDRKA